jgi:hypothetical protein
MPAKHQPRLVPLAGKGVTLFHENLRQQNACVQIFLLPLRRFSMCKECKIYFVSILVSRSEQILTFAFPNTDL